MGSEMCIRDRYRIDVMTIPKVLMKWRCIKCLGVASEIRIYVKIYFQISQSIELLSILAAKI